MKLAARPQARVPAEAAAMLAQYIGEVDHEVFGLVCAVSLRELKLEPAEHERRC